MKNIFEISEEIIKNPENIQNKRENYKFPDPRIMNKRTSKYAIAQKVVTRDLISNIEPSYIFSRYTKEQIVNLLRAPDRNEKALRDMSIYLYHISNQYKAIVNYFANMPTFSYLISPLNLDKSKTLNDKNILSQYYKVSKYIQNMNIAHEFAQGLTVAYREDVFYSYIWSTDTSFTLQRLDANYCKLTGEVDGCLVYAFDFQYFIGKEPLLEFYPAEFQTKFKAYQGDNTLRWQELEPKNIICLKVNEDLTYPLPPFVSLFGDIANIQDYKDLYKSGTEMENYKLLHAKIPFDKEGVPLIDGDLAKDYYVQLDGQLPEFIGLGMSPFEIVDYKFDKTNINRDNDVRNAEEAAIRASGTNPLIFGVSKDAGTSAQAAKLSITVNETAAFKMLRQIERNINRLLKDMPGTQKFNITILDVTHFNKFEYLDVLTKVGQYGQPLRGAINASLGINQSTAESLLYLENQLLKLQEQEKPMLSSNTQPVSDTGGRPTNADSGRGLTESGEQTLESGANENR